MPQIHPLLLLLHLILTVLGRLLWLVGAIGVRETF